MTFSVCQFSHFSFKKVLSFAVVSETLQVITNNLCSLLSTKQLKLFKLISHRQPRPTSETLHLVTYKLTTDNFVGFLCFSQCSLFSQFSLSAEVVCSSLSSFGWCCGSSSPLMGDAASLLSPLCSGVFLCLLSFRCGGRSLFFFCTN